MKEMAVTFSFQTKIAVLAGAITGAIVLAASVFLWKLTYQFNLESLDRDIHYIAQRNMMRLVGRSHWERLEESLSFLSSSADDSLYYFLWVETRGRKEFASLDWPTGLDPSSHFADWRERRESVSMPAPPLKNQPMSESNPALEIINTHIYNEYVENRKFRIGVFDNFYTNMAVAVDIDLFEERMNQLKRSYFLVVPFALLLAVSGAWFVARRSIRPVESLTLAVESVTEKGLDQRIDEVGHEKEFLRLVQMFNEMMARLEKAFYQARRFSADASHELKTPIARLQMELEDALKKSAPESKDQESYSSLLDELSRLRSIVEKLTLLSSSDKGKLPLALEEVDLGELMARVAEDWEAMAGVHRIEVSVGKSVRLEVDTLLLEQALHNLMSNALKYGSTDGSLRLSLSVERTVASIRVWNQGRAIHESDQDKIFDRFYRANSSGGDRSGGGLGLSLTREIARAHNGDVILERSDGEWTVFRLEIPLAQSETV